MRWIEFNWILPPALNPRSCRLSGTGPSLASHRPWLRWTEVRTPDIKSHKKAKGGRTHHPSATADRKSRSIHRSENHAQHTHLPTVVPQWFTCPSPPWSAEASAFRDSSLSTAILAAVHAGGVGIIPRGWFRKESRMLACLRRWSEVHILRILPLMVGFVDAV